MRRRAADALPNLLASRNPRTYPSSKSPRATRYCLESMTYHTHSSVVIISKLAIFFVENQK